MYDKIFFIGTGRVAKRCLEILKDNGKNFTCLNVEQEDFPVIQPTCKRLGVEYKTFQPTELKSFLTDKTEKILIISAHNGYIFPRSITDRKNITIINFHNAYLPYYRGRNAPTWEIYNDEKFGGATWHIIDSGIDTGKVIVQDKVPISNDETALSLLQKSAEKGISLFEENFYALVNMPIGGGITNSHSSSKLYLSHEVPNNGYLDLNWDFEQTYRFLRAMDYRGMSIMPVPKIELKGEVFFVESYTLEDFCPPQNSEELRIFSEVRNKFLCCQLKKCD